MRGNLFSKEYNSGRKDQFDVDYAIFKKCAEEAQTKKELVDMKEKKFNYVISRIVDENAKKLLEDMRKTSGGI